MQIIITDPMRMVEIYKIKTQQIQKFESLSLRKMLRHLIYVGKICRLQNILARASEECLTIPYDLSAPYPERMISYLTNTFQVSILRNNLESITELPSNIIDISSNSRKSKAL